MQAMDISLPLSLAAVVFTHGPVNSLALLAKLETMNRTSSMDFS